MLEVVRREVAAGSVRESLRRARDEFLPDEIREDSVARWVMNFDDLDPRSKSRDEFENASRSEFWALDLIVTSTLQRQIPFYFASLFHIGRQWKVSASALGVLKQASSRENVRRSAKRAVLQIDRSEWRRKEWRSVLKRLLRRPNDRFDIAAEALSLVLQSSERQHTERLQESRGWWSEWRDEVETLRQQVERLQEVAISRERDYLGRELAAFAVQAYRPPQLRLTMEVAGVKFLGQAETTSAFGAAGVLSELWPVLFATMSQLKYREPFAHDLMLEMREVLHDTRLEIEYGESRRVALERLRRKYADADPFERYLPLRSAADEKLRNLILEHTLPGYGRHHPQSPWLSTWAQGIEYDSLTTETVAPANVDDEEVITGFARWADCVIKDALPNEFLPGETWDSLLQRIFETEWINTFAKQTVKTNETDEGWTFGAFATLVREVAAALNKIGYHLIAPDIGRLKEFWSTNDE
jgi:hypothetical protein